MRRWLAIGVVAVGCGGAESRPPPRPVAAPTASPAPATPDRSPEPDERDPEDAAYEAACRAGDYWRGCGRELRYVSPERRTARLAEIPAAKRDLVLAACCDKRLARGGATADAAVLKLAYAIREKEVGRVQNAIADAGGLEVQRGTHLDAIHHFTLQVGAASLELDRIWDMMQFADNALDCGAAVNGIVQCTVNDSSGARYTVRKAGARFHVVRIDEPKH